MRRYPLMIMATAMILLLPSAALAVPPTVVADFEDSISEDIPAEFAPCGFGIHIEESVSVRVTEFYDQDGLVDRITVHVRGTTVWSTDHGEVWEHWNVNEVFDPNELTSTQTGSPWNGHAGAGGIVINDSGRIVIDVTNGEALVINGPHQAWEGDFEAFCEVLAP